VYVVLRSVGLCSYRTVIFLFLVMVFGFLWCLGVAVNTLFCCVVIPHNGVGSILNFFLSAAYFVIDASSAVFLCVVILVGLMTQIYSTAYMRSERSGFIFISLLGVFIVSMCALVLANSFSAFFVAWELIGFCSFV
jgi:NADH:ubiquinone oxidoreductase subunit 5 (subunit L)/multisubunit Na+/H+ antiporter MnhA subunit